MKQSWIVGIFMLYAVCLGLSAVMTGSTIGYSWDSVGNLLFPEVTNWTLATVFSNIGAIISGMVNAILLNFPNIWTGVYLWFYYIVVLPIAVSFMVCLVVIIRGGSST